MNKTLYKIESFAGVFRVQYQQVGDLVASFCWCDTTEEIDTLVASWSDSEVTQ